MFSFTGQKPPNFLKKAIDTSQKITIGAANMGFELMKKFTGKDIYYFLKKYHAVLWLQGGVDLLFSSRRKSLHCFFVIKILKNNRIQYLKDIKNGKRSLYRHPNIYFLINTFLSNGFLHFQILASKTQGWSYKDNGH